MFAQSSVVRASMGLQRMTLDGKYVPPHATPHAPAAAAPRGRVPYRLSTARPAPVKARRRVGHLSMRQNPSNLRPRSGPYSELAPSVDGPFMARCRTGHAAAKRLSQALAIVVAKLLFEELLRDARLWDALEVALGGCLVVFRAFECVGRHCGVHRLVAADCPTAHRHKALAGILGAHLAGPLRILEVAPQTVLWPQICEALVRLKFPRDRDILPRPRAHLVPPAVGDEERVTCVQMRDLSARKVSEEGVPIDIDAIRIDGREAEAVVVIHVGQVRRCRRPKVERLRTNHLEHKVLVRVKVERGRRVA